VALIENAVRVKGKTVIDLNGPSGNAYALLSIARYHARKLELNWPKIEAEMTSGDFRHLVEAFDKHFGAFIDLALPDDWSDCE